MVDHVSSAVEHAANHWALELLKAEYGCSDREDAACVLRRFLRFPFLHVGSPRGRSVGHIWKRVVPG